MREDSRRSCNGVRIHPYLGAMLSSASNLMRQKCESKFRNDQFNRVALPLLETAKLIVKVDPKEHVSAEVLRLERRLIKSQMNVPIWLFEIEFYRGQKDPEQIREFLGHSFGKLEPLLAVSSARAIP